MRKLVMVMLALFLSSTSIFAQSNTGNLTGTVTSPDGGVIPGATITVVDNQTGRERTGTATDEGTFIFPQLEVGLYTVRVTTQGFKTFIANDVKIDIGREYSLNATLEIGAVTEEVTVTAGADIINQTSGELATTVSPRQVLELPLNGRNPVDLVRLQAGSAANGNATVVNGLRPSFSNVTRDGLNIQDNFIRTNAISFQPDRPNVDDTGEFTVVTQNAGADAGYGSVQVQLVTPRGGDRYGGALFIYNRNSVLGANSFLNNALGTNARGEEIARRPFLNRNQFGGKLGGPLPLPRFGEGGPALIRGKSFFFTAYEGFRLRNSTSNLRTILLPEARNGVFTYTRSDNGQRQSINILPLAGFTGVDPLIQSRFLANLPTTGNTTESGDQLNTTGFRFNQLQNQDRESFTLRLDHDFNERNRINGIYTFRKELLLRPDVDTANGAGAGFNVTPFGFQDARGSSITLAYQQILSASSTNEIRGGFRRDLPGFDTNDAQTDFQTNLPLINSPESNFLQQGRNVDYYNIQDNAVVALGNHSLRFGGQGQFFRINPFNAAGTLQSFTLGTNPSTPALTGAQFPGGISPTQLVNANNQLALLGGIISSTAQTFNVTSQTSGFVPGALTDRRLNFEQISLYASDQWRVTPQLTLNFGLRYEIYTPIREQNGLAFEPIIANTDDPLPSILNPNGTYSFVGTNAGGNNQFFKPDRNNFAPVFSFAYSPTFKNNLLGGLFPGEGRTVLRGGVRVSYANDEFVASANNALNGNQGLVLGANRTNLNGRFSAPPVITTPAFQSTRTFLQNNELVGGFGTVFAIDPNLETPRITEYNLSFEREIGFQTAIQFTYVGNRATNLVRSIDYNQINISGGGFLDDFNRARSNLLLSGNRSGAFNAAIAGSQRTPLLDRLTGAGLLANGAVTQQLINGNPGELAFIYLQNDLVPRDVRALLLANPNTGVANLLTNGVESFYNAAQFEIRRRFSQGFSLQANYTFQKTLTNSPGVGQSRVDPFLDNARPELEYARADFDQTHVFNFNTIAELPFGAGRRFFGNANGFVDRLVGGFQLNSIIRVATGAPLTITDPRGTFNRAARSARQTASTSLSKEEIRQLISVRRTPCGVFLVDPAIIKINREALAAGRCNQLVGAGFTGRAAEGFGTTPFAGQVFFNNAPGTTSGLERGFINGPNLFNVDLALIKNIPITERSRIQLRAEAFNVFNRTNFFVGTTALNINSTNFGRVNSQFGFDEQNGPRVIQLVGRIEF